MAIQKNKYPAVIVDESINTNNSLRVKTITVEEWEDYVVHHTHAGLVNGTAGSSTDIQGVLDALAAVQQTLTGIQTDISDIKPRIERIETYIDQDIQIDDNGTADTGAGEGSDSGDGPSLDGPTFDGDGEVDDDL